MLDQIDRQLIRALQLNPRAPFSRIADVMGVSEQTVARRYRRLRDRAPRLAVRAAAQPAGGRTRRPG